MEFGNIAGIAMNDAKAGEFIEIATQGVGVISGSMCFPSYQGENIIVQKPKPVIEKGKIYKLEEEIKKNELD